jgi:hypothetical protein
LISHSGNYEDPPTTSQYDAKSFAVSLSLLFAWLYMFFFVLTLEAGHFIVVMFKMLSTEVTKFLQVYFIFMLAFGTALSVLNNYSFNDSGIPYDTSGSIQQATTGTDRLLSILSNFEVLTIGILSGNYQELDETSVSPKLLWLFVLLSIAFVICTSLLLFNLLIAMMSNSYRDIEHEAKLIHRREILNMVLMYEKGFIGEEEEFNRNKYRVDIERGNSFFPHGPYLEMISSTAANK